MLDKEKVLYCNEVECDLYEENGYIFGVELDLFNNHNSFYCKTVEDGEALYQYLADNVYVAIDQFNAILWDGREEADEESWL